MNEVLLNWMEGAWRACPVVHNRRGKKYPRSCTNVRKVSFQVSLVGDLVACGRFLATDSRPQNARLCLLLTHCCVKGMASILFTFTRPINNGQSLQISILVPRANIHRFTNVKYFRFGCYTRFKSINQKQYDCSL